MSYNAGYDVSYYGYHYDTGCIDFPEEKWQAALERRVNNNRRFFYIKDFTLGILYNIIHEEEFMAVRKKYESV